MIKIILPPVEDKISEQIMSEINGINSKTSTDYIKEIYDYNGQWDVPSKCGLMIKMNDDAHIVIASELYDDNPGTSVNYWNCQIASMVCRERNLDPSKLVFIEHTPDRGSKLENYRETFDRVIFQWDGKKFSDPDWEELTREQVDALLKG
jgi:hypothetical protein